MIITKKRIGMYIVCGIGLVGLAFYNPGSSDRYDKEKNKEKVIVWGINPLSVGSGNQEQIDYFNNNNEKYEIIPQSVPGTGSYATQDISKLIAAIAAGNSPDLVSLDRFTAAQFAARKALEPLDEYIEKDGWDIKNEFVDYAVKEITFDGHTWAIPNGTDTRLFYWNKECFREAGLDPEKPPQTWDELLDYAKKLTKEDAKGNLTQIGFIPNFGNSWLYLYGFQNGGKFLSEDGRTAMLNQPEIIEALQFMVEGYDLAGGAERINAYQSTFQGEINDPFIQGKVAMLINGNWVVNSYARYAPSLDYGVALAPTPDGTNQLTWSGGWSWAVPRGAKNIDGAYEVAKYLVTDGYLVQFDAQKKYNKEVLKNDVYIPDMPAHIPTQQAVIERYISEIGNPNIKAAVELGYNSTKVALMRPVSPVGEILWTEHTRAIDKAIYKDMTPQEALDTGNKAVQEELNKFWKKYDKLNEKAQ